jgi:flagellar basal-body rod modification protein FlgD
MTTSVANQQAAAAAASAGVASSNNAATAQQQLTGNLNTFLTLLTTQLQNQDPLNPMDSDQFTQQLVEYSQVEQQINTNSDLQSLISLQQGGAGSSAVGYLGKTVTVANGSAPLTDGQATWNYSLAAQSASTTLTVTNANGQVVYTGAGTTNAGSNTFNWNGEDNSGNQLPDGVYTLAVNATGSTGAAVTSTVSTTGVVSEVNLSGASPEVMIGTMAVPLTQITSVQSPTS